MSGFDGINLSDAAAIGRDFLRSALGGDDGPKLSDLFLGVSEWFGAMTESARTLTATYDGAGSAPITDVPTEAPERPSAPSYAEMVAHAADSLTAASGTASLGHESDRHIAIAEQWRLLAEMVATTEGHR